MARAGLGLYLTCINGLCPKLIWRLRSAGFKALPNHFWTLGLSQSCLLGGLALGLCPRHFCCCFWEASKGLGVLYFREQIVASLLACLGLSQCCSQTFFWIAYFLHELRARMGYIIYIYIR